MTQLHPSTNGSRPDGVVAAAAAAPPAVLEISDLSIVYRTADTDVRAVDHVDLALAPGETVGLAGESGSGKSTLALGACRLLRPPAVITGGSVIYRGSRMAAGGVDLLEQGTKELRKLRWREISIVFQSAMNALNPSWSPTSTSSVSASASASASCSTSSASRASAWAATRTSSPAACASA